jgi:hypothetical protein
LEAVETSTEQGNTLAAGAIVAAPPTFNGITLWSVFRRKFEIVAEHNLWSNREKLTYIITALQGRAADVLPGIPTNTTYENTLQALEDRFGDQNFAAAYRCQLTRTQKAGESMQNFATAIEELAHRAYPTLPVDHIGREKGKAFANGVQDPDTKIQMLLGGEKTVNEDLRQTLELQAVLVTARTYKNNIKTYRQDQSPPTQRRNAGQSGCWKRGEPGYFGNNYPYGGKADDDRSLKYDEKPNRDTRESTRRPECRPSNIREDDKSGGHLSGTER